ncbi:MAG: O-antigen ligase family protein [Elusimicrobia bacterium]|nr:O-antigen ligase family protein [Elusimicrobiota bacterium]
MSQKQENFLLSAIKLNAALILICPLIITKSVFFPFTFPKVIFFRIFSEISLAIWLLLLIQKGKNWIKWKHPILLSLGIFMLTMLLSIWSSVDIFQSFWSSQERMTGILTFMHLWAWTMTLTSLMEWKDWKRLFLASILVCLAVEFIGLEEFKGIFNLGAPKSMRIFSTLGNPIYLSVYSVLNLFLALFIAFRENKPGWYLFSILFSTLNLSIAALTGSRSVILAIIASITVSLLVFLLVLKSKRIKIAILSILILSLSSALFLFLWLNTQKGQKWAYTTLPDPILRIIYKKTSTDRFILWQIGLNGFKKKPILGWGWENFNLIYHKYYDPDFRKNLIESWYDRSHNQLIDILALNGIIGFLAYAAFWITLLFNLIKKLKDEVDYKKQCSILTLISMFTFYFIQNLFVFDSPATLIIFYFSIGLVYFILNEKKSEINKKELRPHRQQLNLSDPASKVTYPITCALLVALFIPCIYYFNVLPFIKNKLGLKAYKTTFSNFNDGIELFKESLNSSSFTNPKIRNELVKCVLLNFSNPKISGVDLKKGIDFALQESNRNVEEHPYDISYYLASAILYRVAHSYDLTYLDKAEELMKQAERISPKRPEIQDEIIEVARLKALYKKQQELQSFLEKKG